MLSLQTLSYPKSSDGSHEGVQQQFVRWVCNRFRRISQYIRRNNVMCAKLLGARNLISTSWNAYAILTKAICLLGRRLPNYTYGNHTNACVLSIRKCECNFSIYVYKYIEKTQFWFPQSTILKLWSVQWRPKNMRGKGCKANCAENLRNDEAIDERVYIFICGNMRLMLKTHIRIDTERQMRTQIMMSRTLPKVRMCVCGEWWHQFNYKMIFFYKAQ